MIKKILVRDYLKGYGDMTAEERKAFVGRVGEWLAQDGARLLAMTDRPLARSQSLMTVTTRWTAEDTKAVTDGIMLMSALVGVADTWLPTQIYMKSAYRAIRQVVSVLSEVSVDNPKVFVIEKNPALLKAPVITEEQKQRIVEKYTRKAMAKMEAKEAADTSAGKPQGTVTQQELKPQTSNLKPQASGAVPARPKHIDQYVHLLPKATQERAAEYGELMRQLGEARDNMQLLMDDDHASAKSREQWAKQATKLDKKIRAIRDELDREWDKVAESGRVRVDALGNAFLTPDGESSGTAADGVEQEPAELTSEQKKRRRELRKWLIDLRRGKEGKDRERRIEQWRVNWQEYLTLEPKEKALVDEKILEAAKHFGIDIGRDAVNHGAVTD